MRSATDRLAVPAADALGGLTSPLPTMPTVCDIRPGRQATDWPWPPPAPSGSTSRRRSSEAAVTLASELSRIPGIERFGGTRLRDLDRSGPRTLRTLWGAAKGQLDTRYGDVTIGKLLDEFEQRQGGPGATR